MTVSILPRGTHFARMAKALGASQDLPSAACFAEKHYGEHSPTTIALKAAVAAGTTDDATWAKPVAEATALQNDFLEAVRTRSVIGKLPDLRRVPTNTAVPVQTGRGSAYWVGQGAPKPLTKGSLDSVTLPARKIVGIVPLSRELMKLSGAVADNLVRRDLVNAAAALADASFLDLANSGVVGVQPASITSGLVAIAGSGDPLEDIEALIGVYAGDLETAAFVTDPLTATQIGLRTFGSEVMSVGARGGEIAGIPCFTSNGSPRSSSGGQIVLMDQAAVLLADDGIRIDVSEQATLQMADNPQAGAQTAVSLWQSNLVAFLMERRLNWTAPLAGTVVVLDGAAYVSSEA